MIKLENKNKNKKKKTLNPVLSKFLKGILVISVGSLTFYWGYRGARTKQKVTGSGNLWKEDERQLKEEGRTSNILLGLVWLSLS